MFSKSQKQSPNLLTPIFNIAQLNIEFGHIDKAERSLRILLSKAPKDIDILASMATVKMIQKEYKSSEAYFLKIDDEYLKRADISNHYAMVLYKLGKFKKAYNILKSQKVSIITPVVKMRKQLALLIKKALEKEKQDKLTNKNKLKG
jgi:Tfp pilus assembly protein PilF